MPGDEERRQSWDHIHPNPQLHSAVSRLSPSGSLPRFLPPVNLPNSLLPEQTGVKIFFICLCHISSPLIVLSYQHLKCPSVWVDHHPQGASSLMGETKPFPSESRQSEGGRRNLAPGEARVSWRRQTAEKCSKAGGRNTEGGSRAPRPEHQRPLLPDRAPGIPTRVAGVNPVSVPGLQRRRGGQAEPSACGPPITAANPVGGGCGRSSRWRRLREEKVVRPRGRGEPGVPRARRPGRVPPRGGRGAEAAAGQKHIQH